MDEGLVTSSDMCFFMRNNTHLTASNLVTIILLMFLFCRNRCLSFRLLFY